MNGSPEQQTRQFAQNATPPIGIGLGCLGKPSRAPLYVSLYGLYDLSGLCVYVGQTSSPAHRQTRHVKSGRHFILKVLRRCEWSEANRLEKQIIRAYKRQGQAQLNKRVIGAPAFIRSGLHIVCCSLDLYFVSIYHAAQYFGCSHSTIRKALNEKAGWLDEGNSNCGKRRLLYFPIDTT